MNEWEWNLLEDRVPLESVLRNGVEIAVGDRVRLMPRAQGDAIDLFLAGKSAVVEAIEQDYEDQVQLAVVIDEDPGRDLGFDRQPAHRFFFVPEEVELVEKRGMATRRDLAPSILIAGIGNIFFGDDAFGVEVAQRLVSQPWPEHVTVIDFGIRGFDLANALCSGYDVAILVDACQRGSAPGTLTVIEPDAAHADFERPPDGGPHGLDPVNVIRLARAMGTTPGRMLVVGCEPETCGGEAGQMGLSAAVSAAVVNAVPLIESLVTRLSRREPIEETPVDSAEER